MSHDDVERLRYEQRERGLRDWATSMTVSREEGREEGLQKGLEMGHRAELMRMIQFCDETMQQPVTPRHELESCETFELQEISRTLQAQVRNRLP